MTGAHGRENPRGSSARDSPELAWHLSQFAEPKRATAAFEAFVQRHLEAEPERVLDAGCGAGANIRHLNGIAPRAAWSGLDRDAQALGVGRDHLPGDVRLFEGDLRAMTAFRGQEFDVCLSVMVISWLPDYREALREMVRVTRGWIFLSSLFWPGAADVYARVRGGGLDAHYNVYSLPLFRAVAEAAGADLVSAEPFEIDIDLPRPPDHSLGTWTERTADGRRLQISGPLLMPWWFVAVRCS